MQGGETELQQSVRRLTGLFGQVLVELGNLMGASTRGALPAGEPAQSPAEPAVAGPGTETVGAAAELAPSPVAADEMRERIERAVDAGLAMLVADERSADNGGGQRERADEPRELPAAQSSPAEEAAGGAVTLRAMPPVPPAPETRILRPAWMRASAPPLPSEESTASEAAASVPDPVAEAKNQPPAAFQDSDLFLVCEAHAGRHLAIPWNWVTDTRLSARGTPEAFTLSNGTGERQVTVSAVVGIWTKSELEQWQEEVRWLSSLDALHPGPAAASSVETTTRKRSSTAQAAADNEPARAAPRAALATAPAIPEGAPAAPRDVWVVSPSALARRFLMRHLEHAGLEIHESSDLDDPLLPADLGSVGALFLDESLQEQWRDHPAGRAGGPPLVLLTVDGVLQVPAAGERSPHGAVLPRPFERCEVESVVGWLRSLWRGGGTAGDEHHGDEEDDTWLFADPFGSPEP